MLIKAALSLFYTSLDYNQRTPALTLYHLRNVDCPASVWWPLWWILLNYSAFQLHMDIRYAHPIDTAWRFDMCIYRQIIIESVNFSANSYFLCDIMWDHNCLCQPRKFHVFIDERIQIVRPEHSLFESFKGLYYWLCSLKSP